MTDIDTAGLVERLLGRGPNQGHGHVFPRPDGVRARCGGTGLCRQCQQDRALVDKLPDTLQSQAAQRASKDAEIARLREALDSIDMRLAYNDCDGGDCERPIRHARAVARAALTQHGGDDGQG